MYHTKHFFFSRKSVQTVNIKLNYDTFGYIWHLSATLRLNTERGRFIYAKCFAHTVSEILLLLFSIL